MEVVIVDERLSDYDISFLSLKSYRGGSHSANVIQLGKGGKSKCGRGGNGVFSHLQTLTSS